MLVLGSDIKETRGPTFAMFDLRSMGMLGGESYRKMESEEGGRCLYIVRVWTRLGLLRYNYDYA